MVSEEPLDKLAKEIFDEILRDFAWEVIKDGNKLLREKGEVDEEELSEYLWESAKEIEKYYGEIIAERFRDAGYNALTGFGLSFIEVDDLLPDYVPYYRVILRGWICGTIKVTSGRVTDNLRICRKFDIGIEAESTDYGDRLVLKDIYYYKRECDLEYEWGWV